MKQFNQQNASLLQTSIVFDSNNVFRMFDDMNGSKPDHYVLLSDDGQVVSTEYNAQQLKEFAGDFAKAVEAFEKQKPLALEK